MMRSLLVFLIFFFPLAAQAEKITVVASFSILGDMVHEVAGDTVNIKTLVGPDGDAHVYEPTPSDVRLLKSADLVIINGLGFEVWIERLAQYSGYKGPVVIASRGITPLAFNTNSVDPHAWQSLKNGLLYIANIRDALINADPANTVLYRKNAEHYSMRLQALDSWVQAQIFTIPESKRRAITSHDALGYFADSYGVVFIAPLGVSTAGDASAGDIAGLINQIRKERVRAVFMENMSDARLVRQLATDGGAVIGGTLYSDALSSPDGPAPTYIAMFRHNVATMVKAMKAQ